MAKSKSNSPSRRVNSNGTSARRSAVAPPRRKPARPSPGEENRRRVDSALLYSARVGTGESVSQLRAKQESGMRYRSSREAATRESPARQCRETKVEESRVPEGRHTSCDTDSGALARPSRAHLGSCLWPQQL